ncbi:hypothetical protein BTA51_02485 [Hahella sp. CCB-MM4]|uniref:DUF502 domain-containing protein n=1 Tax=Hahella sp. (strain CCB-MM4) TaxID=1926491 RepID=UPI000B9AEBF3|nr:DUF502 domain-containing protein [Hahella sp. CCB-MM4]OZG75270.1 hypothetical protein BTA51_02485 [Hahella sp. CCB-MM4]
MNKLKLLIRNAFIGGVVILLPLVILGLFFRWLFRTVTDLIQPITDVVIRWTAAPEILGDLLVILLIILACILVGSITATGIGRYLHAKFDGHLQRLAPGYQMVKDIVNQLFGDRSNSPFKSGAVAEVSIFGNEVATSVTAIVTSKHEDGRYTVFVPTGPNPTTGFVFHVSADCVTLRPDIKVESAIRTIISCGAGSAQLFQQGSVPKTEKGNTNGVTTADVSPLTRE